MGNNVNIQAGDIVHVDFNGSQYTLCNKAEVMYIPCCAGDCWIFRDVETGHIHYVSEGCTVTKFKDQKGCKDGKI